MATTDAYAADCHPCSLYSALEIVSGMLANTIEMKAVSHSARRPILSARMMPQIEQSRFHIDMPPLMPVCSLVVTIPTEDSIAGK